MQPPFNVRVAGPQDAEAIVSLILELAEYERLTHEAVPDVPSLRLHLSREAQPRAHAFVAEVEGQVVGFALYFYTYSTFLTRWGVYLEDLYVRAAHRGRGIGLALFRAVASEAVERGCRRMDWAVLDWNEPAIGFYKRLGAEMKSEWRTMRLADAALVRAADGGMTRSEGGP